MRASLYNAMPQEGVDALVAFMQEFERSAAEPPVALRHQSATIGR
jgi:hypothetical protein